MATVILDHRFGEQLREERKVAGSDRWDEVWEGTYMMAPLPNNEHQELVGALSNVFLQAVPKHQGMVLPGTNVSDREKGWERNYRCPDVAVYLANTGAKNCGTHWCGGPDFAVEIVSDDDRTRDKIPFYASVGTRELLIVDRDPWSLELLQLSGGSLKSLGTSIEPICDILNSKTLPLSFRLTGGQDRPAIEIRQLDGKLWVV
jgi:Uma2 family endonuclease